MSPIALIIVNGRGADYLTRLLQMSRGLNRFHEIIVVVPHFKEKAYLDIKKSYTSIKIFEGLLTEQVNRNRLLGLTKLKKSDYLCMMKYFKKLRNLKIDLTNFLDK